MQDDHGGLVIYGEESLNISFLCYHRNGRMNVDIGGEVEIGVVIHGRIRMLCLCFTGAPVSTVSLV